MRMIIKTAMVAATLVTAIIAAPPAPAQEATGVSSRNHVVDIRDFEFVTATLTIRQGDTVEWINRDIVPHTATAEEVEWDTNELAKGQSNRITFSSVGTMEYLCLYHPNMRGKIIVTAK